MQSFRNKPNLVKMPFRIGIVKTSYFVNTRNIQRKHLREMLKPHYFFLSFFLLLLLLFIYFIFYFIFCLHPLVVIVLSLLSYVEKSRKSANIIAF